MDEDFSIATRRIRKKQSQCNHPSWCCPVCRLYKDNIKDEQRLKIEELERKVAEYEQILTILGFCFEQECLEINTEIFVIKEHFLLGEK